MKPMRCTQPDQAHPITTASPGSCAILQHGLPQLFVPQFQLQKQQRQVEPLAQAFVSIRGGWGMDGICLFVCLFGV